MASAILHSLPPLRAKEGGPGNYARQTEQAENQESHRPGLPGDTEMENQLIYDRDTLSAYRSNNLAYENHVVELKRCKV
jgi:hypothetical protein